MTETIDKYKELMELNNGDKVKLVDGDVAEFVRLKRKNFEGQMNGKLYNIPVELFAEVLERVDMDVLMEEKEKSYRSLNKGELFYLVKGGDAILYRFVEISQNRLIGENVVNGGRARIDVGLYGGKVSDL